HGGVAPVAVPLRELPVYARQRAGAAAIERASVSCGVLDHARDGPLDACLVRWLEFDHGSDVLGAPLQARGRAFAPGVRFFVPAQRFVVAAEFARVATQLAHQRI